MFPDVSVQFGVFADIKLPDLFTDDCSLLCLGCLCCQHRSPPTLQTPIRMQQVRVLGFSKGLLKAFWVMLTSQAQGEEQGWLISGYMNILFMFLQEKLYNYNIKITPQSIAPFPSLRMSIYMKMQVFLLINCWTPDVSCFPVKSVLSALEASSVHIISHLNVGPGLASICLCCHTSCPFKVTF